MRQNNSPWLTQLHHDRIIQRLEKDTHADVVIVGGGIAGITTLFFLLKYTDKKIVLIEGHQIAHGATGHNAGQIVAEFEKPLIELVKEHGMNKTIRGLGMVEDAWELLDEMMSDAGLTIPRHEFIGYGGYSEVAQLVNDLETELIKSTHGLIAFPVMVARESGWVDQIPKKYESIITVVDQVIIDDYLGTDKGGYHAVIAQKKGVMNSALFTEKLALWCMDRYKDRVVIVEHSYVHGIELAESQVVVITNEAQVTCKEIVLCTNGFENFYIHEKSGTGLDTQFHHEVHGAVGYMTGFVTHKALRPIANYYYEPGKVRGNDPFTSDPYFYVTRRPFTHNHEELRLISVGGPEVQLAEREIYHRDYDVAHTFHEDSITFMQKHFSMDDTEEVFFWHGLMGYTKSGVRLVGREPRDPRLMYNLGCNGVGILPSIMGSRKIARHVAGEEVPETIFDPKHKHEQ